MDWFRSFHGAPTDPKWLVVARYANVRPIDVTGIWWALLDFASQNVERGSIEGIDTETLDFFFGLDEGTVDRVIDALREKGLLDAKLIVKWEKRQPKREDLTATARKQRERGKNDSVTEETSRTVTHRHAPSHTVTPEKKERKNPPYSPPRGGGRGNSKRKRDLSQEEADELEMNMLNAEDGICIVTPEDSDVDWYRRVARFEDTGFWMVNLWGPQPGAEGCRVPARILAGESP